MANDSSNLVTAARKLCIVLIFLSSTLLLSRHGLASEDEKVADFERLGGELGRSLQRSVAWKGLEFDPEFDQLANLTKNDVELCVNYIARPERTEFERYVAGFSAYKLTPSVYTRFVALLLKLMAVGLITTPEIMEIITPSPNSVLNVIYNNYSDANIQDLINTLEQLPDLNAAAKERLMFDANHGGFLRRIYDYAHELLDKF